MTQGRDGGGIDGERMLPSKSKICFLVRLREGRPARRVSMVGGRFSKGKHSAEIEGVLQLEALFSSDNVTSP